MASCFSEGACQRGEALRERPRGGWEGEKCGLRWEASSISGWSFHPAWDFPSTPDPARLVSSLSVTTALVLPLVQLLASLRRGAGKLWSSSTAGWPLSADMLGWALVIALEGPVTQCLFLGPSELLQCAYCKVIPLGCQLINFAAIKSNLVK